MNTYVCHECKFVNVDENKFDCVGCGECLGDERPHCHDVNNYEACIPFIEGCEEHSHGCAYDCHDECACQECEG